jgi:CheY-like chemotaxis protein
MNRLNSTLNRSVTEAVDMNFRQVILLVDDSEFDVLLMRAALKRAEFDPSLQVVINGEEAIAYLAGTGIYSDRSTFPFPTLVLLDVNMPKKNGFDVLRWLRAHPFLNRTPVTMLTASLRSEDVDRAFDLGANSYLVKPSNLDQLTDMLRTLRDWIKINQFPSAAAGISLAKVDTSQLMVPGFIMASPLSQFSPPHMGI